MKKLLIALIYILGMHAVSAQTVDINSGCAPLEVNFTGPSQVDYFWDFADGGFSDLANPSHIFDESGTFVVELFDSESGNKTGEITITVYEATQFMISASENEGCSPLQVQFTNESIVDPNVNITGYFWDFGDGGNSTDENPTHIYDNEGSFTVTLTIESDEQGCTQNMSFTDFIKVSGAVAAGFSIDNTVICDAPATFNITNNTVDAAGYIYSWDFDNGMSSDQYNPNSITYEVDGTYTITMIVDNGEGCEVTLSRTVVVGMPQIELSVPDTMCIYTAAQFNNSSNANQFQWTFGSGSQPQTSSSRNPIVSYDTPGPKIVTFSSIASNDCKSDTFFTIIVEDPSAEFTIDPTINCDDPSIYTFSNPNTDYAQYIWTIDDLDIQDTSTTSDFVFTYEEPLRDSFYINRSDTFFVQSEVITSAGCRATSISYFVHRAPQAHFVPNISRGCAPLTVTFDELSLSNEAITLWEWDFGDGNTSSVNSPDDMTHTFSDPGEYYVKLAIENEAGCTDTSAAVVIYVGEPVTATYEIDKSEICLYESITMTTLELDDRVDAYHFNTDEGRIGDCYKTPGADHQFIHTPGTFPVTLTLEYNGCFSEIDNGSTVTVNGSKSRIRYMTNCIEPLSVMLQDSSVNATSSIWYMNGDTINMDTITENPFVYTFDSTGDYNVYLITDDDSSCAPDTSVVNLKIRDIKAEFELPEYVCANTLINLSASLSEDVDESCSKGYTWYGVARRPRTIDYTDIEAAWLPGTVNVRLITEDVNGCKDTLDRQTEALDLQANFTSDVPIICYPSTVNFTDLSTSDTTIVDWNWSFGSNQQNPSDLFADGPDDSNTVGLIVTDAIGCMDTINRSIPVYEPTTDIDFSPANIVCLGETISFTATDFTDQGSFLNYSWTFGDQGSSMEQNPTFTVTQPGVTTISLVIEEDNTGCNNEYLINVQGVTPPIAEIGLDETEYCADDNSVLFMNNSIISGPGGYLWNFDNGLVVSTGTNPGSSGFNPSSTFEAGTYDVTLTATSIYGCSDSDTQTINISSPSGSFQALSTDGTSASDICIGDMILFTMIDTVDVSTYTWDFGEGSTVTDENPVTHQFDFYPPDGNYDVVLSMISETGCKTSVSIPVSALNLNAVIFPDSAACIGDVDFVNMVDNPNSDLDFTWTFGNGDSSTDFSPTTTYVDPGNYIISLTVSHPELGCSNTAIDTLIIEANPVLDISPDLVCDTLNDDMYINISNFNPALDYTIEPDLTMNGVDSALVFIDIQEAQEYIITAISAIGCTSTDTTRLSTPTDEIIIPNVFSPNNDGNNDYFDIIVQEKVRGIIEPVVFQVYNRWGNLLYDNEEPLLGWDGKLKNGNVAPAEIYTYVIKVNNGDSVRKGTVTLIK